MILLIYNEKICREILLPNVYDTDWPVELSHAAYDLKTDITIRLENMGGVWYLRRGTGYEIVRLGEMDDEDGFVEGAVSEIRTDRGETIYIVASRSQTGFNVMKKYDLANTDHSITIGSKEDNTICYRFRGLISGQHLKISRSGNAWVMTDTSTNGVFVDTRRVKGTFRLDFGEHISFFGFHCIFLGAYLLIGCNCGNLTVNEERLHPAPVSSEDDRAIVAEKREHTTQYFNRAPRNRTALYRDKIEIEAPPQPKQDKQKPTYLIIGPAFSMAIPMVIGCLMMILASYLSRKSGGTMGASPFLFMGLTIAIGAAVVGAVWAVLNLKYDKQQKLAEEEQRFNAYSSYLVAIAGRLREYYIYNTDSLKRRYPSASKCLGYNRNSPALWNRNTTHEDFLFQRLGLGEQDFQVDITIPRERFSLVSDSLQDRPAQIKEEFRKLVNVPVGVSLIDHKLLGIAGPSDRHGATSLMQVIAAGIAASHSYTDVKMVFLYDEKDKDSLPDWECMRWLPHVWSEDRKIRFMSGNRIEQSEILFHLANVIRSRAEKGYARDNRNTIPKPYYIIFVSKPSLLQGELLTKYIYDKNASYGITAVLMAENLQQLPNACDVVIENDNYFHGIIDLNRDDTKRKQPVHFDHVERSALEAFGKRLANINIKEVEVNTEIPDRLGFLEMYGVHRPEDLNVAENWRKNRTYNSMKALVGRKAGGADCYLDIHEKAHGPHGLIAGTTGSGKSETLQTYILSLAVNYSPDDVNFFIIDYKGGGMANLFTGLPHLAGKITNLSGNQVHRAMISIKSENLRRQKLFAHYGVNHINAYTRLYKEHQADVPIPHLFIVIDEFAELKREEPDFMRELISVAQVGRSLGVHLILATQKPSGTVDDNIKANAKFRLCLRVQDRQDSTDMLGRPDAAYLTQAGRCYLQVGNDEIFELFQSGYSGSIYTGEVQIASAASMIGRTGRVELMGRPVREADEGAKAVTEMDAVIKHLRTTAFNEGYDTSAQLWMPVLSDHIVLKERSFRDWAEQERNKWELRAVVGRYDDPANQMQGDLSIDFAEDGHLAVCGNVVSGKSTFLQTMIYSLITAYSPEHLQMYILDYSGQMLTTYAGAPHVGGIVTDSQPDRADKLFVMLDSIMNERKQTLKGGNFAQFRQNQGEKMPAILIVIDNYASFREKTADKFDARISRLIREGIGYGIYMAISSAGFGMSEIPTRIGDHINNVISLEQQDKYKYMEVLRQSRLQLLPEGGIKGRGLAVLGDKILEFQTALCLDEEDDFSRGQKIEQLCEEMSSAWNGILPGKIPEIPDNPRMDQLSEEPGYSEAIGDTGLLPFAYDAVDASVYSLKLINHYCLAVTGRARTGRTTILRSIIYSAVRKDSDVVILEKKKGDFSRLEQDAEVYGCTYAGNNAEIYKYFSSLLPEFSRRNKKKQELIKAGHTEEEIYAEMMKERPVFIFIDDLADLIHMAYKPDAGVGSISGFLENILEKGKGHAIYFIAGLKVEDEAMLTAYKAYNFFISYKRGMVAGGNLQGQQLLQFQNILFTEQAKPRKKGYVFVSDDEDESVGHAVVVPVP